eukprot:7381563-Prymnesium_polylepis.1
MQPVVMQQQLSFALHPLALAHYTEPEAVLQRVDHSLCVQPAAARVARSRRVHLDRCERRAPVLAQRLGQCRSHGWRQRTRLIGGHPGCDRLPRPVTRCTREGSRATSQRARHGTGTGVCAPRRGACRVWVRDGRRGTTPARSRTLRSRRSSWCCAFSAVCAADAAASAARASSSGSPVPMALSAAAVKVCQSALRSAVSSSTAVCLSQ